MSAPRAALAALLVALAWRPSRGAAAPPATIRVAIVEQRARRRAARRRLEIVELGACPRCRGRRAPDGRARSAASARRAQRAGVEIDGRRARRASGSRSDAADPPERPRLSGAARARPQRRRRSPSSTRCRSRTTWPACCGPRPASAGRWRRCAPRPSPPAPTPPTTACSAAGKPYHIVASTAHQQYAGRVPPTSPVWDGGARDGGAGAAAGRASCSRPSTTRTAAASRRTRAPCSPRATCRRSSRCAASSRPARRTTTGRSTSSWPTWRRSCGATTSPWAA